MGLPYRAATHWTWCASPQVLETAWLSERVCADAGGHCSRAIGRLAVHHGRLVGASGRLPVRHDFGQVSLFTLAAALIVLLLRFRRPGRVVLVLLPAGLGALWTGGLFAASDPRAEGCALSW